MALLHAEFSDVLYLTSVRGYRTLAPLKGVPLGVRFWAVTPVCELRLAIHFIFGPWVSFFFFLSPFLGSGPEGADDLCFHT